MLRGGGSVRADAREVSFFPFFVGGGTGVGGECLVFFFCMVGRAGGFKGKGGVRGGRGWAAVGDGPLQWVAVDAGVAPLEGRQPTPKKDHPPK